MEIFKKYQRLLFLISLFFMASSCFSQSKRQPNIIFILADDLGYGDLSYLGSKDIKTPNIDQLAAKGMKLTNFYANSTVCSPSRASLLSGRYPDQIGVPGVIRQNKEDSWGYMTENVVLLPAMLKTKGYQTALIGKWHLGFEKPNLPNDKGFDLFKGFLGDMMDDYYTHLRGGVNWMRENEKEIEPVGHATDIFTGWTVDYLSKQKNNSAPFFLYLAYNAPHFPIQPPVENLKIVKERELGIDDARAKNAALVEHMDMSIGRVMKALEENGLSENTIIVFLSDNGGSIPHAQQHGLLRGGKQDMFEGGIKIPAFVVWKNNISAGSMFSGQGMLMDMYPTILEMLNIKQTADIDGRSMLTSLLGKHHERQNRYVYWVRKEGNRYKGLSYYAARYGDYKILQNAPGEPFLFFNIKKDPFEKSPLTSDGSAIYQDLIDHLNDHILKSASVPWEKE